jgi:hypothetical protein
MAALSDALGAPYADASERLALAARLLAAAVIVGFALRLAGVLAFEVKQTSDLGWYLQRAMELVDSGQYAENGIPTAFWPVGYPAFLAALFLVFGSDPMVGQIANAVLSVGCIALLYWFCLQRFPDPRVAGIAAVLLAVYPNNVAYSVGLYSEPLFTFLLLLAIVLLRPCSGLVQLTLAGAVLGLATLVKAQTQLLGPILIVLLLTSSWHWSSLRRALLRSLPAIAAMSLVIAPWTLRNAQVMGKPVIVSTNGGMSLLYGNNPSMKVGMKESFAEDDPLLKAAGFSVADQVAADARAKGLAWAWIRENPGQFIALMPWKAWRLWAYDGEAEWVFQAGYTRYQEQRLAFRAVRMANQAFYVVVLLAGLFGMLRLLRVRDPQTCLVPFLLLFFTALSMVFSGQSRYHWHLMPFVTAYAAWALLQWRTKAKEAG